MTDKELLAAISLLKDQMIAVSTGGPRIDEVKDEYRDRWATVAEELKSRSIENPNPHDDLWKWYGKWSSGDLPTYQSRRRYVNDLYSNLSDSIRKGRSPEQTIRVAEPTGWARVDRTINKARESLASAKNEEDFQGVGLLCREILISLAQAVYDPARHPPTDDKTPSDTDAARMLDAYVAAELAGAANEAVRRHAKAALALALALQHRRTATVRDAAMCAEATTSVVNLIAIVDGRGMTTSAASGTIPPPRESDKALFETFKRDLPSKGSIAFIDENNLAGFSFQWERLRELEEFHYKWDNAEHEFLDAELEEKRRTLHMLINEYLAFLSLNTWMTENGGWASVPQEWETENPQRFHEVVTKLHDLAGRIVGVHQDLIRTGRRLLES